MFLNTFLEKKHKKINIEFADHAMHCKRSRTHKRCDLSKGRRKYFLVFQKQGGRGGFPHPGQERLGVDSLRYMLLASFLDAPNPWDFPNTASCRCPIWLSLPGKTSCLAILVLRLATSCSISLLHPCRQRPADVINNMSLRPRRKPPFSKFAATQMPS